MTKLEFEASLLLLEFKPLLNASTITSYIYGKPFKLKVTIRQVDYTIRNMVSVSNPPSFINHTDWDSYQWAFKDVINKLKRI